MHSNDFKHARARSADTFLQAASCDGVSAELVTVPPLYRLQHSIIPQAWRYHHVSGELALAQRPA